MVETGNLDSIKRVRRWRRQNLAESSKEFDKQSAESHDKSGHHNAEQLQLQGRSTHHLTIPATNHASTDEKPSSSGPDLGVTADIPAALDHSTIKTDRSKAFMTKLYLCCKAIILSSWINVLLVFVPIGIVVEVTGVDKNIVFAMNAIAIIPLASLLSFATESVASDLGDTIGALMNVTFGNAVELIIFIIALTKNEIRIVQASLLGSILANLLLILGMCFLFGGLRFREQIYNSTVTQMSACLLSLSVMSLLLPTAFHASFNQPESADHAVLQVSRGTSVILLLVYILYLLFQLKSHAYLYQSTPQHVIDEESHPGIFADILNSSHSSDESSSSSDSDSDTSSRSNTTAKRIRRVLKRGRRARKTSAGSNDAVSQLETFRTRSARSNEASMSGQIKIEEIDHGISAPSVGNVQDAGVYDSKAVVFRDFQPDNDGTTSLPQIRLPDVHTEPAIATETDREPGQPARRPFNIRGKSVRDALPVLPAMPKVLTHTVFSASNTGATVTAPIAVTGITPRALHRSHSLPGRLNQASRQTQAQDAQIAAQTPLTAPNVAQQITTKTRLSRTAAITLLVVSTGLVAVCAEFLVSSIDHLVDNTSISEAFVGLIILPIVGNAAEHITAVTVAGKNKMDLAIGVAVGSSIQIALFVTPVIVLLGWILSKDMSLYFSLFETISLFVAAFIVNFLIIDGRSNYLEGALLIAAYVIIALAAFFYPDEDGQNFGGTAGNRNVTRF